MPETSETGPDLKGIGKAKLSRLELEELRQIARARDIPVIGEKPVLVQRILNYKKKLKSPVKTQTTDTPRRARASELDQLLDMDESLLLPSLRRNSSRYVDRVWTHRDQTDAYTKRSRSVVETLHSEVDHVIEVQICNHAWEEVRKKAGAAVCTRNLVSKFRDVVNDDPNLNVTSRAVNRKKLGPFRRFLNEYQTSASSVTGLEELARVSCPKLVDNGTWELISDCVVKSYEDMETSLIDKVSNPREFQMSQSFIGELNEMLNKMGI
jgi:hypothetical protein